MSRYRIITGKVLSLKGISSFLMLVAAILLFYFLSPQFLSFYNVRSLLELFPEFGIVVLGVTLLMIGGEFDLSVGSIFALAPILTILFFQFGVYPILAAIISLAICALIGAINALIVVKIRMPSFIATLATMMFWRGLVLVITQGSPLSVPKEVASLGYFTTQWVGPFRLSLFYFIFIGFALWFVLERTSLGNWFFAVGGNPDAARARGIDPARVKTLLFILVSFLAGLAGLIQALRIGSAIPSAGEGWELDSIAASVIGGTSLFGGIGSMIGGSIGAFLIRIIGNGLVLAGAPGYYFRMFIGLVIVGAVFVNIKISEQSKRLRWK